jgi:hypothetical protein
MSWQQQKWITAGWLASDQTQYANRLETSKKSGYLLGIKAGSPALQSRSTLQATFKTKIRACPIKSMSKKESAT